MRLCERMHLSPLELAEIPIQKVMDWLTVMSYEGQIAKEQQSSSSMPRQ